MGKISECSEKSPQHGQLKGPKTAHDTPRPSSQHKGDVLAPEGQRAGNRRQKQEPEDQEEGEGNKGEGKGVFVPEGQRTASGCRGSL